MELEALKDYIVNRLQDELPSYFVYHSVAHTLDVWQAVCSIADDAQLADDEKRLLQTAALLHDFGYVEQANEHETISCRFAHQILPQFGYSEAEITQICEMIMATKVPQAPQNYLSQILCDADLDYLGRSDFFDIGNRLFQEFLTFKIVQNEKEWHLKQVSFLSEHQYFTSYSKKHRLSQKEINLSLVKDKLKRL